jgi:hypothetical protein
MRFVTLPVLYALSDTIVLSVLPENSRYPYFPCYPRFPTPLDFEIDSVRTILA